MQTGSIEGLEEVRGTLTVKGDVVNVSVDWVQGNLGAHPSILTNRLADVARGYGANTLRIEADIFQPGLYKAAASRLIKDPATGKDVLLIPLR